MKPFPVFPAGHPGAVGMGTVEVVMMEVEVALVVLGLPHSATLVEVAVGAGVLTHRGAIGFDSVLHTS